MKAPIIPLLISLLLLNPALAESQERLEIFSDNLKMQGSTRLLSGNVEIRQGSMEIHADSATLRINPQGLMDSGHILGSPLHIVWVDSQGQTIKASSHEMEWQGEEQILILRGEVIFQQGNTLLKGNQVRYDLSSESLQAEGDRESRKRIQIIMPSTESAPDHAAS